MGIRLKWMTIQILIIYIVEGNMNYLAQFDSSMTDGQSIGSIIEGNVTYLVNLGMYVIDGQSIGRIIGGYFNYLILVLLII